MSKLHQPEVIWERYEVNGECWEFISPIGAHGYGVIQVARKKWLAHRLAYTLAVGPIPDGLQLDHLCRNRRCIRPTHLEAVTPRVNTLRSLALSAMRAAQTECQRGHPFTPENTYMRPDRYGRICRACQQMREARR